MEPDRDRKLDDLLRQSLTARSAGSGTHLDAEVAAAWADGTLSEADRRGAEAHAADCARCQALMAALVRTAPPAPVRASWFRFPRFAWVAPLAAAAAAVVVWVALPPSKTTLNRAPASKPTGTLADVRPSSTNAPVTPPKSANAVPAPTERLDKTADDRVEMKKEAREQAKDEKLKAAEPQESTARAAAADVATVAPPAGAAASAPAAAPQPAQAPPPQQLQAQQTPSPAPQQFAAEAQSRLRQNAGANALAEKTAPSRDTHAPIVIASPNPDQQWRIVAGPAASIVQRSTDGGSTWMPETMDPPAVVTAGASPSPTVCWLVGPRGTVILTTDGRSWQRLTFPEAIDLISVRATDDRHATVTAIDGRVFATNDRGVTWSR